MNRIRLLPEQVANQIAAGEVIERPASVVKELVENALDAGGSRITVEIQAGGRSLVRVTDDGTGMSKDDALLALERHATSKIQRAEDLASIDTMGFRGEAVPSIASVSRFTLTTRERESDSPEATQVVINGGRIVEVKAAGHAPGTTVEVRQLFFNLPARRKFLRSEETERAHILHYLTLAALAHPQVGFTLLQDQRMVWQLPPQTSSDRFEALRERLKNFLGAEVPLLAVDFSASLESSVNEDDDAEMAVLQDAGSNTPFRVWGFIGAPGVSRGTRENQHVFVNRRPVENRGLNFALMEGYHTALMKGRYPVCCLFVEIDPAQVDVNIHPAKREVKFHQERTVRKLVTHAVRQTLLEYHTRSTASSAATKPAAPIASKPAISAGLGVIETEAELPNLTACIKPLPTPAVTTAKPTAPTSAPSALRLDLPTPASKPTAPAAFQPMPQAPAGPTPLLSVPLRLVGVVGRLYVVLESDRGLVLLDQHAAHERILFEQMLQRMEQGNAPSQRLLLPETIELPPRDTQFLHELLPTLTRLGVGLSEFGERTFLLDALPPFVKVADARRYVLELIDELKAAGNEVNLLRLGEHVVAKTVCRHAVKANDPLAGPELENLVNDLRKCTMPYTCPHGRPTLIEMSYRELEKKFGRTA